MPPTAKGSALGSAPEEMISPGPLNWGAQGVWTKKRVFGQNPCGPSHLLWSKTTYPKPSAIRVQEGRRSGGGETPLSHTSRPAVLAGTRGSLRQKYDFRLAPLRAIPPPVVQNHLSQAIRNPGSGGEAVWRRGNSRGEALGVPLLQKPHLFHPATLRRPPARRPGRLPGAVPRYPSSSCDAYLLSAFPATSACG